ncbi:MAG TPA: superoxide dismutase family protein [Methylomirabilota bacterium]
MRMVTMAALGVLVAGCALTQSTPTDNTATAELRDSGGQPVGTATFTEVSGGVRIVLDARGLPPGQHGVHVHAVGTCEPPAFTSAGGHFNPGQKEHGMLNPNGPHAGDLPNLTIGTDGAGRLETFSERITLTAGPNSVFDADGSALVVHAGPDDFKTDPTGNSGNRIACGIIVKPSPPPGRT